MRRIPRGIVDEHVARTKFTLTRHAPAPGLAEFVDYHWVLRWDLGENHHDQHVLPHLAVNITFFPGACGVYGPGHTLFTHRLTGRAHGLGVRFRPGCFRPFLGAPVRTLADRSLPLPAVFGARSAAATESVRNAASDSEMISAADKLLIAKHETLPPSARTASAVVETGGGGNRRWWKQSRPTRSSRGLINSPRAPDFPRGHFSGCSRNTSAAHPSGRSGYTG